MPVTEVRFSDLMDLEFEQFKATEKKPNPLTIDVNAGPMKILERHAKAIVVKKTRDNADHGDFWKQSK